MRYLFDRESIILVAVIIALTGCTGPVSRNPDTFPIAPSPTQNDPAIFNYKPPQPSEGSLWTDNSQNLFIDRKARMVGDLITVRISENKKAKLHAKTDTNRDSSITANADFFGYLKALERANNTDILTRLNRQSLINTSFKPTFVGEGTNDRDGTITAYITATVINVFPNGNLYITGKREIKVNNETEFIYVSGIVRQDDIDLNNEVQSTFIADAKIEYSGKGVIADKQKPGWMMRILDNTWPF